MSADAHDIAVAQEAKRSGLAGEEQIAAALKLAPLPLADALLKLGVITAAQREGLLRKAAEKKGVSALLHYRLTRKLGEGGMGTVYLAEDTQLKRRVALKVLPRKFSGTPELLKRFRREAETAVKLRHPNIVGAYASGEDAGFHFYVMEYVEGETLDHALRRGDAWPVFKAAEVVLQAARGLQAAHALGFVHRDVKPSNIIVTPQGQAKILDLGLTKNFEDSAESLKTQSGTILGTPHYIAPEQARGAKDVDGRADIYSLGATFYHLLSGEPPYNGTTGVEVIYKHVHEPPPDPKLRRPDLPPAVDAILRRMLAKKPEERYPSCAELVADLEAALAGRAPRSAAADEATRITPPPTSRSKTPLVAGAAAVVALLAAVPFLLPKAKPPEAVAKPPLLRPAPPAEIDLLKDVDPAKDTIDGLWAKEGKELTVRDGAPARIRLRGKAPSSYDLRVEFTRLSGGDAVTLILAREEGSFLLQLGGFSNKVCGFAKVDDKRSNENATTVARGLKDGASYVCVVEVRPERVTARLDGQKLAEWTPSSGPLTMDGDWDLKTEAPAFGLGSWGSPTTFHAVKLIPR